MRQLITTVMIAMLTAAAPAAAQETKKVDPVVVTATTVETLAGQLGVALSVIPGEDFKTYQYSTIDDAFRNIPGVGVQKSGGYGKLSTMTRPTSPTSPPI